ncbi:STAS domain-containing protein [Pseudalkalibacillus caeni]|uniref:STAS domain-containing protein n=1 Tax=Exobacillus caeni TaxID=2574798 RepID=A0A5R9FBY3_9BACL|nr:STAS domain-containing protein [Pseudalkalibacillus caeni]TLS37155.1 STAS domain-containing protein [Pseudalkalibacillus caeni]
MASDLQLIAQELHARKEQIARNITSSSAYNGDHINEETTEDLIQARSKAIEVLADSLTEGVEEAKRRMEDWAENFTKKTVDLEMIIEKTMQNTSGYRKEIWNQLKEISSEYSLSQDMVFEAAIRIDDTLDKGLHTMCMASATHHSSVLKEVQSAFMELSAPIVPITNDVAVLPLIGDIDTHRAQVIMEKTLEKATNLKLNHLFIDLSGVQIVDTMVAKEIEQVATSLDLIGVKTTLTGLRPQIAQTMVNLGIELRNLDTRASLHQAIKEKELC